MKELLTRNIGLKLISLLIAAIIWFGIMSIADPVTSKRFEGINVSIINDDVITSRGYQYTVESGNKVDIICKGKTSIVTGLSASDFKAYADFNTLNSMYMAGITVECTADAASDIIITQRTENMAVKLEDQATVPFSVRVELEGNVRDGYYCNGTTLSSSLVQVTGAVSQVNAVKEVVAYIDINDKTKTFSADSELVAYDISGEPIDSMKLGFSQNAVTVTVEILETKAVDIEVVTKGTPALGYYVEKLDYAPKTVLVAAPEATLRGIDKLTVEIDVTGLSKYTEEQVMLNDLITEEFGAAVTTVDEQPYIVVAATITQFVDRTIEIREQDLQVINVADGLEYTMYVATGQTITIRGAESILNTLTLQDLKLYVDMEGTVAGTWSRQIRTGYGSDITLVSGSVMVRLSPVSEE
ncbi:MAG: hypothetical protein J6Y89_10390 [Lachnospiraceae bacterium]|nr:hypothetical protein [Lachnospiraceae bacterium]